MNDSELTKALADLDAEIMHSLVKHRINDGVKPLTIVGELREGMNIVGERFNRGDYFLSELVMSGELFKESMKLLDPLLEAESGTDTATKFILGTARGDIHDIGKNIFAVLLKAAGFEVYDLGVDVDPSRFVEKLRETQAPILGISGMLTPTFESMKEIVQSIESSGLRQKVKIIIGGGIMTEQVREYTGADSYTTDAVEGIRL